METPFFAVEHSRWKLTGACVTPHGDATCPGETCECDNPLSLRKFLALPRGQRNALVTSLQDEFQSALSSEPLVSNYIVNRIGSPSAYGEVYHVCARGAHVAAKVMGILSDAADAADQNLQEVTKATLVSRLVRDGVCPYFPLVYFAQPSAVTRLPATSEVGKMGRLSACRGAMVDWLLENDAVKPINKKLLRSRRAVITGTQIRNETELMYVFDTNAKLTDESLLQAALTHALSVTPYFLSTLMYSEFADGDLLAFLSNNTQHKLNACLRAASESVRSDVVKFGRMCSQLVEGVEAMQQHLGMVHNDLHMANVLVSVDSEGGVTPLLHDFGLSKVVTLPSLVEYPELQSLVDHNTVTDMFVMTSEQRVRDLRSLLIDKMLSYGHSGDIELSTPILALLERAKGVIDAYEQAGRTDEQLFAELQHVFTLGAHGTPASATSGISGGYVRHRRFGSKLGFVKV